MAKKKKDFEIVGSPLMFVEREEECPACKGYGYRVWRHISILGDSTDRTKTCPLCKGKGVICVMEEN